MARHQENINGAMTDINQLLENQVQIISGMTGYGARACHCGENTDHLSDMSYGKPLVALGSGRFLFPDGNSSAPLPVPPLAILGPAEDIPIPSLGTSSSDKENSSLRSFQSTQQVVSELVEIVEVDPDVDDEEARALSDTMDAEVRSHLFQRCKLKKHPQHFAPFPKGWEVSGPLYPRRSQ